MRIYDHCNLHSLIEAYNTRLFAFFDHTDGWSDKSFCSPHMPDTRHSLLYLNRRIQAELWDLILRRATVEFHHPLTDRKMFWNNWHNVYSPSSPYLPPKLERMALGNLSFEFMRRIHIEYSGCSYAIGRPHVYQLSREQTRFLVKLAESVHCEALPTTSELPHRTSALFYGRVPIQEVPHGYISSQASIRAVSKPRDNRDYGRYPTHLRQSHGSHRCAGLHPEKECPRSGYFSHPTSSSRRRRRAVVKVGCRSRGCHVHGDHQIRAVSSALLLARV